MKLLAIETSTDTLSIGVSRTLADGEQVWLHSAPGGAQASTHLIGAILDLLRQAQLGIAQLDAICFGCGPGSFTGLRTACAVAQGLAFGAGVPVLPVDSLLAVAEEARSVALADAPAGQITALLDARMDEMYVATWAFADAGWSQLQGTALVQPHALVLPPAANGVHLLAGNVFATYGARLLLPDGTMCTHALPTAAALLRLAPRLLAAGQAVPAAQALPSYIRDKVAKTTLERASEKAAAVRAML